MSSGATNRPSCSQARRIGRSASAVSCKAMEIARVIEVKMRQHRRHRQIGEALDHGRDVAQARPGVEQERAIPAGDQIVPVDLMIFRLADREEPGRDRPRSHTSRRTSGYRFVSSHKTVPKTSIMPSLSTPVPRRNRARRHAAPRRRTASVRRLPQAPARTPRQATEQDGKTAKRSSRRLRAMASTSSDNDTAELLAHACGRRRSPSPS